jgi:hypothetical protein
MHDETPCCLCYTHAMVVYDERSMVNLRNIAKLLKACIDRVGYKSEGYMVGVFPVEQISHRPNYPAQLSLVL